MIKSINETLNNDERYTNIKWRRSTTANVIDRTTRSATAGAGGNDDDNEEEDRKPKKIKVSNEKASISINELEKTLVKAFNGGEKGLKKVGLQSFSLSPFLHRVGSFSLFCEEK